MAALAATLMADWALDLDLWFVDVVIWIALGASAVLLAIALVSAFRD